MAVRAVSIEIGYLITRVCELDYKSKNHKVHNSFLINTPEGVINDGVLDVTDEFVELLKKSFFEHKIRSKQVIFAVNSTRIASRDVSIPFVKENRIADVVRANASDYFPVDLSQYQLGYSVLGVQGEEKNKKYRLKVLAAPQNLIQSYYDLAEKMKLEVLDIDYAINSAFQVAKNSCEAEATNLLIKVEGRNTTVVAIKNKTIEFSRSLAYGVGEALTLIKDTGNWGVAVDYIGALEIANRADTTEDPEMKQALGVLVDSIGRLIEFYTSRSQDAVINHIYLTGMGADFRGLSKMIGEHVDRPIDIYSQVEPPTNSYKVPYVNIFMTATGASYDPISLKKEDEKKAKKSGNSGLDLGSAGDLNPITIGVIVLIIGLIAAGAMAAFATIRYTGLKATNIALKAQKDDLSSVIDIYNEYKSTMVEYDAIMGVDKASTSFNDELVSFIEEMEDRMPSDIAVSAFSADASAVAITMKVSSKSEAAKVIEELRDFKSLLSESVTVSSLMIEMDEMTNMPISVTFSVNAMYNPNPDSDEAVIEDVEAILGEE